MTKILVTGGAGFIGSHVVDILLSKGHQVSIIDNFSSGLKENVNSRARFYEVDLRNYSSVKQIIEKEKPEVIYHLAAQANVRKSLEDPVEDAVLNILSTIHLLEIAKANGVKHFIFSSTGGALYGDTKTIPTPEDEFAWPISPYGCAKLAAEKYINFYTEVYGMKTTILRYGNVYGPRQNPSGEAGVISIFIDSLLKKKRPTIYGGIQTRDFVYVKDVAKANLLAMKAEKSDFYNVATGKETDIIGIYNKISRFFKDRVEPEYLTKKTGEQMKSCLHCEKIKQDLGWEPETSIDEGLAQTYAWFVMKNNK